MSAEVNDDGPVDRESVVTNLLILRLEQFLDQKWTPQCKYALEVTLQQSMKTMAMVFNIRKPLPIFDVEYIPPVTWTEKGTVNMLMLDPHTKKQITVAEWLS